MKNIALLILVLLVSPCFATSWLAEAAPEVSCVEASALATDFIQKKEPDSRYYIFKAECGYHEDSGKRAWLIGFAQPAGFYNFVIVFMDKKARLFTPQESEKRMNRNK